MRNLMAWGAGLCLALQIHAQTLEWLAHYGYSIDPSSRFDLAQDGQGAIYGSGTVRRNAIFGSIAPDVRGDQDVLLIKWDSSGTVLWAKASGAESPPPGVSEWDEGNKVYIDPLSGRILQIGRYSGPSAYFDSIVLHAPLPSDDHNDFVACYSPGGEVLWAHGYTGYSIHYPRVVIDASSNTYVFGYAPYGIHFWDSPVSSLPEGGFRAKYSPSGLLLSALRIAPNCTVVPSDRMWGDTWVLCGTAYPGASLFGQSISVQSPASDGYVAKTDTMGNIQWLTRFTSDSAVRVWQSTSTVLGKTYISGVFVNDLQFQGSTIAGLPGMNTAFVAAIGPDGNALWALPITSPEFAGVDNIKSGPDGYLYICGRFNHALGIGATSLGSAHGTDGFVAKLDTNGNCLAAWNFGPTWLGVSSVLPTTSALYVASEYDSTVVVGVETIPITTPGIKETFIAKFNALVGFTGLAALAPPGHALLIYANPNQGTCSIELPPELLHEQGLMLRILDVQGRVVQEGPLNITEGTVHLDIRAQAAGTYMAEVVSGNLRYTGRIVFE